MTVEGAGGREFAQLVTNHVLGHQHGNVLVAVIDAESDAHELRQDGGTARPGLDHVLAAAATRGFRLLEQIAVYERAFPKRTGHVLALPLRVRTMNLVVRLLVRVLAPLVGLPQGVTGRRPPLVRPSPTPWGRSIGFLAVPRTWGRLPFQTLRPALPMISFMWSGLETAPTVAMQVSGTLRTSDEFRRTSA